MAFVCLFVITFVSKITV